KYDKRYHWPPTCTQQCWYGDRDTIGRIGIETRVWGRQHRHIIGDLDIDENLIGVKVIAKVPEWWPLQASSGVRPEIPIEHRLAVESGYTQLIVKRIE